METKVISMISQKSAQGLQFSFGILPNPASWTDAQKEEYKSFIVKDFKTILSELYNIDEYNF